MGNVWILFKNNIYVSIVKKKSTFILGLVAPLIILFIMSKFLSFGSSGLNIGLIDNDNTETSQAISQFLDEADLFTIITLSEEDIDVKFSEKSIDGLVIIPAGFQENILKESDLKITIKGRENEGVETTIGDVLLTEVSNLKNLATVSKGNEELYLTMVNGYKNNGKIKIEKMPLNDLKSDYLKANILVGFIIFFMLLRGSFGSEHYYDEKRENIFNRIFIAPVTSTQYYLADLLSNYSVVILQALVGVIGISFIETNTGVKSMDLFIIMSVVGLVSVTMAICIRAFSKNSGEFGMIFNCAAMILTMVGGCFVPLDLLPDFMDKISYLTPTRWAMQSIADLQLGLEFSKIIPYILIIILFAILFFVVGAYKTSKSEKEFTVA